MSEVGRGARSLLRGEECSVGTKLGSGARKLGRPKVQKSIFAIVNTTTRVRTCKTEFLLESNGPSVHGQFLSSR